MPKGVYIRKKDAWNKGLRGLQAWHNISGLKPDANKGKKFGKHSYEHRRKISEGIQRVVSSGKHNFWKGGVTSVNKLIRSSLEYKLWRESVFTRDNYTCVMCLCRSGNGKAVILNADHIKPFAYFPELRFAIDNGRTLCVPCHKTTDTYLNRWYGKQRVARAKKRIA
jgi:uncharacterized protein YlzI (FlbEa/FlbD family)